MCFLIDTTHYLVRNCILLYCLYFMCIYSRITIVQFIFIWLFKNTIITFVQLYYYGWFPHTEYAVLSKWGEWLHIWGHIWKTIRSWDTWIRQFVQIMFKDSIYMLFFAEKYKLCEVGIFLFHFLHVLLQKYQRYSYQSKVLFSSFHLPKKFPKSNKKWRFYRKKLQTLSTLLT